jgi:hypothetical protein
LNISNPRQRGLLLRYLLESLGKNGKNGVKKWGQVLKYKYFEKHESDFSRPDPIFYSIQPRLSQHRGKLFFRLMQQAVITRPPPVKALYVSKPQPIVAT